MRLLISALLQLIPILVWAGQPVIAEAPDFREVTRGIQADSVVIFDLDNTLMEPVQTLGSDQFFTYLVRQGREVGLSESMAKQWAVAQNGLVQPRSRVRPVEVAGPALSHALQRRRQVTFALTARPVQWAEGTLLQVQSLGVDFRLTAPVLPDGVSPAGAQLRRGVLFLAPGFEKGDALLTFLDAAGLRPRHVVFVDDKANNVRSVAEALARRDIPHVAFRYGGADARVRAFDPRIADYEWHYFLRTGVFLSDEETLRRLRSQESLRGPQAPARRASARSLGQSAE